MPRRTIAVLVALLASCSGSSSDRALRSEFSLERLEAPTARNLNDAWGSASGALTIVGEGGTLLRLEEGQWTSSDLPDGIDLKGVFERPGFGTFAVGDERTIYHLSRGDWSLIHSGGSPLNTITGPSRHTQQLLAAGAADSMFTLLGQQPTSFVSGSGDGFSARPQRSSAYDFNGSFTTPDGEIILVGNGGVIARYAGKDLLDRHKLVEEASPTDRHLHDVWGPSTDVLIAVGDAGTIAHFDRGQWRLELSPTSNDLYAVWGHSSSEAYAAGADGTLLSYDGTTWRQVDHSLTGSGDFSDIAATPNGDAYIVGDAGTVLRFESGDRTSSVWCDSDTRLCWQDPQKSAHDRDDVGLIPAEANRYCGELILGGHHDWRLPTVEELRTLIAGSPGTAAGTGCGVRNGSSTLDGFDLDCLGQAEYQGPAPGGCYLHPALRGTCNRPDPAVVGHPLETWASGASSDDPERWIPYVSFDTGAVGFNHACSFGDVRCVRDDDGSPTLPCSEVGACDLEYRQDPTLTAHCDQDLCEGADKLVITLRVPEALPHRPHQLLAFLYEAGDWQFPPLGPPDGGTDTNQIIHPEIDMNRPLEITIPGCTYYREELLEGAFQLYMHIQLEEKFPPIPVDGEYFFGGNFEAIEFPFDGIEHRGTERRMELTFEPVGCPAEAPIRCPDSSCASSLSACTASSCATAPDDSGVLTCRYRSIFIDDNCADFPIAEGWTRSLVEQHCAAQQGADTSTVVVSQSNSCLVEKGGFESSVRCEARATERRWWSYGAPQFVCNLILSGDHQTPGPFCSDY